MIRGLPRSPTTRATLFVLIRLTCRKLLAGPGGEFLHRFIPHTLATRQWGEPPATRLSKKILPAFTRSPLSHRETRARHIVRDLALPAFVGLGRRANANER